MRRSVRSASVLVQSKPSKHYGTDFWFIDGPFNGRAGTYQGKRVRVTVGHRVLLQHTRKGPIEAKIPVAGEYVHQVRNVGPKLGYEHYYQWFGPTPETLESRRLLLDQEHPVDR